MQGWVSSDDVQSLGRRYEVLGLSRQLRQPPLNLVARSRAAVIPIQRLFSA